MVSCHLSVVICHLSFAIAKITPYHFQLIIDNKKDYVLPFLTPYSLLPTPYSLLPTPYSLLPTPYSLLPTYGTNKSNVD